VGCSMVFAWGTMTEGPSLSNNIATGCSMPSIFGNGRVLRSNLSSLRLRVARRLPDASHMFLMPLNRNASASVLLGSLGGTAGAAEGQRGRRGRRRRRRRRRRR